MPQDPREGTEDADEVRQDAAAEMKHAVAETESESSDTGERTEEQGAPRTTPTIHEAQRATAAATPSEEASKQARAAFAQQQEDEEVGSSSERSRTARDIVASGEAPLAPLPGRAEPADDETGSPAQAADADEAQDGDQG